MLLRDRAWGRGKERKGEEARDGRLIVAVIFRLSQDPQYQGVMVMGFANLTLVNQTTPTGVLMTQQEIDVPIQYEIS